METSKHGMIEIQLSAAELRAVELELAHPLPKQLYLSVWHQVKAELERIESAPHLDPGPIRLPETDPQFLDWLRSLGFGHMADRAITLPAPRDGP
jgi:hypothetical protein